MVASGDNHGSDERDVFRPPAIPTEVGCLHCGEVFDSYLIEWRDGTGPPGDAGAWCCPTPGCDGVGFLFDIWPTDPDWRDEHGEKVCWTGDGDDEADEEDEDALFEDDALGNETFDNPDALWPPNAGPVDPKFSDPSWDPSDNIGLPPGFLRPRDDPPEWNFTDDDIPY